MTTKKPRPPLNEASFRELALHYAARYATSRARLTAYLRRKVKERGWEGDNPPEPDALVERMASLGYVDDAGFARMKGASLARRGYGPRRIAQALTGAGIAAPDRAAAEEDAAAAIWAAADAFARRKRIGPYAASPPDRDQREKMIAAFLRAGHSHATARLWVDAPPGEPPEPDR